jgi:hypothetical protein
MQQQETQRFPPLVLIRSPIYDLYKGFQGLRKVPGIHLLSLRTMTYIAVSNSAPCDYKFLEAQSEHTLQKARPLLGAKAPFVSQTSAAKMSTEWFRGKNKARGFSLVHMTCELKISDPSATMQCPLSKRNGCTRARVEAILIPVQHVTSARAALPLLRHSSAPRAQGDSPFTSRALSSVFHPLSPLLFITSRSFNYCTLVEQSRCFDCSSSR